MPPTSTENLPLSIILPTYNREKYLQKAVESVLAQSFNNFELIVIDDGSTDGSFEYLAGLKDKRVILIRTQNHGEYHAVNLGLRIAKGRYITFIHSDDLLPPESLHKRIAIMQENPILNFVHGDFQTIGAVSEFIQEVKGSDLPAKTALQKYISSINKGSMVYLIHFPTIMFRGDLLPKIGFFDESLPYAGDTDWMFRLLAKGRGRRIPEVLYYYRDHPESRRVKESRQIDEKSLLKKIAQRFK